MVFDSYWAFYMLMFGTWFFIESTWVRRLQMGKAKPRFIDHKGERKASVRAPRRPVPSVGDIILYNENGEQYEDGKVGHPMKGERFIGEVLSYTSGYPLVVIQPLTRPDQLGCPRTLALLDFVIGLKIFKKLSEPIYTTGRFTYDDLDINNPDEYIRERFID